MDKSYRDEFERVYLIEKLPEPLTRADRHLQIFDNYLENTRLRLRSVRVPETKQWSWTLEQRFGAGDPGHWKIAEIHLSEAEYRRFESFEGREIRKNRYFFAHGGKQFEIDLYLGALWGLNTAKIRFATRGELRAFDARPPFAALEVTGAEFFRGSELVGKSFADVQAEAARIIEKAG